MVKNFISFFITIRFFLPQSLRLAIGFQQLFQFEPHTTNTDFISFLIG